MITIGFILLSCGKNACRILSLRPLLRSTRFSNRRLGGNQFS